MAVALTFAATSSATSSGSVASFAGISIGTAAADRVVLALVTMQIDATFVSCTIGGIAAQKLEEVYNTTAAPDIGCAIFAAFLPTGTTANIDVTISAGDGVVGISTVKMTGSALVSAATLSDTDELTGSGVSITLTALTIPTSGGAVCVWANDTNTTACTWTGMSEVSDANYSPHRHSAGTSITAGTTNRVADGATAQQSIAGVAFRQGVILEPGLVTDTDTFNAPTVLRGARTLQPGLVTDDDTFYAPTVRSFWTLSPALYSDADTIYSPTADVYAYAVVSWVVLRTVAGEETILFPALYTDADTFYAPTVTTAKTLQPSLVTDGDTFYAPTVLSARTLQPQLYTDDDTFYAPTVVRGVRTLQPALVTDGDTFYAPSVTTAKTLQPQLVTDGDTFYAPTVASLRTLQPALVTDADTFYAPTVARGAVTLLPSLYTDTDSFFAPTVLSAKTLQPALYVDDDIFYAPTVEAAGADQTLTPSLYTDADDFFAPTVLRGARTLQPDLYTDADAFYAPTVASVRTLSPALYTDTDTFYAPSVTSAKTLQPALYTDADDFFSPTVLRGAITLSPALYTDADTFYSPTVSRTLRPTLYVDDDTFYAPTVLRGAVTLSPALYTDADVFYSPTVSGEETLILPELYTDADDFHSPSVYRVQKIQPDADITDGGWTNELDSNVDLYASVDEAVVNDTDYIKSESEPVADIVTLSLSDPASALAAPVRVRYRYKKMANIAGQMDLTARLMEGVSEIAEWVHTDIAEDFVDASQELSAPQIASITDPANLRIEFEANFT